MDIDLEFHSLCCQHWMSANLSRIEAEPSRLHSVRLHGIFLRSGSWVGLAGSVLLAFSAGEGFETGRA